MYRLKSVMILLFLLICSIAYSQMSYDDKFSFFNGKNINEIFILRQDNYIKAKNLALSIEENNYLIPLTYGSDNQSIFGVSYVVKQSDNNNNLFIKHRFFILTQNEKYTTNLIYENDKNIKKIKTNATFIVALTNNNVQDLYMVNFQDGIFSRPERLPEPISSPYNENAGAFSPDGKKIYFSSNRPGGYGGYDIYESEYIGDGKWSSPRNLGPVINTNNDEICPFLLKDGITLYFSSNGYLSKSNFDIYETILSDEGFFSEPIKLEAPINTEFDDLYFQISPDEKRAYYISYGIEGKGLYELIFY